MEQSGTKTKRFLYDEAGLLIGFSYQDGSSYARYFYIRDQLGHILGIVDGTGEVVVRYTYDAWGNILSVTGSLASTIGQENPFRYKGYYYDSETGYYYCQSRYYVPLWCRWLSSDKVSYLNPESINGINLYMYCGNNPILLSDMSGSTPWYNVLGWIGLGLVGVAAFIITAGMAGAVIGGVAGGIIYGAAIGTIAGATIGTIGGAVSGIIYDSIGGNSFGTSIWNGAKAGFGIGAFAGAMIGGAIGGVAAHSVVGLTNTSFWTGLGTNGAKIAANAAGRQGLTTIGQTFGGRVVQGLTNNFGYAATKYLWISLSKTMASTVAMNSVTLFSGTTIFPLSVYAIYEAPILIARGIDIIRTILGG